MGSRKSKFLSPVTELTDDQVAKIGHATNLPDSEVRRRHSDFLEQYPHGWITREQFYDCLHEVWPESQIDKFASNFFDILDQDRNEAIDFTEFIIATYKLESNDTNQHNSGEPIFLGLLFDMYDRNRNGYLEKRELKLLVESLYDLAGLPDHARHGLYSTRAQTKDLLSKLDTNGDKRLSKQEFLSREYWTEDERLRRFFFNS